MSKEVNEDAMFDYEIINGRMLPIAEKLVAKFEELKHIDPKKILFVLNHKSKSNKKRVTLAKTIKLPSLWTEILYQLNSSESYFYKIEFFRSSTYMMDENQIVALLYSELRRIDKDGNIVSPDVYDWWKLIKGLGRKWFYPNETCANLLEDGVDWKKLTGDYNEEEE